VDAFHLILMFAQSRECMARDMTKYRQMVNNFTYRTAMDRARLHPHWDIEVLGVDD